MGAHFVLTFKDEPTRDAVVPLVKRVLRTVLPDARAKPWLTRLEMENKSEVYTSLKDVKGIELIDWGTKVLVTSGERDQANSMRKVVHLSKEKLLLKKDIDDILKYASGDWIPARTNSPPVHRSG